MADGIAVEGAAEVARALHRIADGLRKPREADAAIQRAAATLAAARTPSGDTGALAAGWRGATVDGNPGATNPLVYAGPVMRGWPGHNIEPSDTLGRTDTALEPLSVRLVETGINNTIRKEGLT